MLQAILEVTEIASIASFPTRLSFWRWGTPPARVRVGMSLAAYLFGERELRVGKGPPRKLFHDLNQVAVLVSPFNWGLVIIAGVLGKLLDFFVLDEILIVG